MKQPPSAPHGSPLLEEARSKLNPEVFFHPVWIRFGRQAASAAVHLAGELLEVVQNLEGEDPATACQVLLVCATYQNAAGQQFQALRTAQRARLLAQRHNLFEETVWAMWGECALAMQQGKEEQAGSSLVSLQTILNGHHDWILADFVDVLRQSIDHPGNNGQEPHSGSPRGSASGDLLDMTFSWLQQWGSAAGSLESGFGVVAGDRVDTSLEEQTPTPAVSPLQHWHRQWQSVMFGIRGEVRIQWTKRDLPSVAPWSSIWSSVLRALRSCFSSQTLSRLPPEEIPPGNSIAPLPPPRGSPTSRARPQPEKAVAGNARISRRRKSEQVSAIIHMLGTFTVRIGDLTVKLPASRGLSLFKYLLLHHQQKVPREILMETFWPEAEPETARNNLNVAMHSLRKALRAAIFLPVIVFEDGAYGLEPDLDIWLDVKEFERCVRAGQRLEAQNQVKAAVAELEAAVSLYQGDFLEQTPYEEWTVLERERLRTAYLDTLDRLSQIYFGEERYAQCIAVCQRILARDQCREDAHGLLMRCYSRQGQHHLALRQYQLCVEALRMELAVEPGPETEALFEQIRQRDPV